MNRKLNVELPSTPSKLFHNCKSFLQELSDKDSIAIYGGKNNGSSKDISFEKKLLDYALIGFAISNILSLVKLFIDNAQHEKR